MVDGDICNPAVPAQQVSALPVDVHDREELVIFKRVEAPPLLWDPSLGGLAVLDHNPSEGVGVLQKGPRQFKARFFFLYRSFVFWFVIRLPEFWILVNAAPFVVLPVLSPSLVIKLSLCLLLTYVLSIPLSLVASTSRPFTGIFPSVCVISVPISVTASVSPVLLL